MTGKVVFPLVQLGVILDNMTDAGKPWEEVTIRLFKNDVVPTPEMDTSVFEEADFSGYAEVLAEDPGSPVYEGDDSVTINWQSVQFSQAGTAVGNTIYGYYMTITVLGIHSVIGAVRFPEPVGMAATGDAIIVVPGVRIMAPAVAA